MLITFGDTSSFGDMNWYLVELRSERTIESTLRRLCQSVDKIFQETAVEIFVPVSNRNLHVFELSTGNCIFARCPEFSRLLQMKSITGIVGLVTEGDTKIPSKAIAVEHSFVQKTIDVAEMAFLQRAETITVGSFVRVLDGDMRDWCGTVTDIHDGIAAVRVEIKTKLMLIQTPVRNLLDLSDVETSLRCFYYGELVQSLEPLGLNHLVEDDLYFTPDVAQAEDGLDTPSPTKHGRQQTVTALVKKLIVTGTLSPTQIGTEVLAALKCGSLKTPKNLSIVHGIIKTRLIEDHFRALDPSIESYRDVVDRFGVEYKFSLQDLASLDPDNKIPLVTRDSTPQEASAT